MSNKNKLKEKFVKDFNKNYEGKCPVCKEQGKTQVLPFGDDHFFCENPMCKVTRHSNNGHYLLTEESIQAPNVTYIQPNMHIKRNQT